MVCFNRFIDTYIPLLRLRSTYIEEGIKEKKSDPSKTLEPGTPFFFFADEYEQRLQKNEGSVELLIAQNLPLLAPGIAGCALHGIIHVGYGYASNNTQYVNFVILLDFINLLSRVKFNITNET